jgi:alpha-amylase/alpha-mannosidase (GH57 family)
MPSKPNPAADQEAPEAPAVIANAPVSPANRFVCVHGHFYQPPRENPWLETVEVQDSATPYHDWNDRITAECYAPNGASRIQNERNEIVRILNNYARMSFNFGPTLLSWLHDKAPRAYHTILEADRLSAQRFSGHGSALAQVYNHIIMPLANERDALTQIRWGIADFEYRFGRKPEGMWLAETAANRATLDLLAREGILFTILAPIQCARVRKLEAESASWSETPNASVDPTQPYRVNLDEGRSLAIFFYDGPGSRAIAFEGLLDSGDKFAKRLLAGFNASTPAGEDRAQLSHVATDGESYGHHHKHGEMALSFAMHSIEDSGLASLTNYGEFLERSPPTWEAEIVENTSWSCAHGIERWRSDCGCNGGKPGWNQRWRKPLRDALDFLRDATAPLAESLADGLLLDLWAARDAYIHVVLHRADPSHSAEATDAFFETHATHALSPEERTTVLELMELERHTQLMYTSCGWFFDEISGIETVQIIAYAGRVLQLAAKLFGAAGTALEPAFLRILAQAIPNAPEFKTGADIYTRYVNGMKIGLEQVGAHYAISSIFRSYPEDGELFCFSLHRDAHEVFASGRGKVALGRARVRSRITEESEEICYAVLHLGDQNLSAAVRRYTDTDAGSFIAFSAEIRAAIRKANLPEVIRLIDRFFAQTPYPMPYPMVDRRRAPETAPDHVTLDPAQIQTPAKPTPETGAPGLASETWAGTADTPAEAPIVYSLTSLFADEQHRILHTILDQTVGEMEDSLRKIYEDHASLLHFLTESGMNPPPALALAAGFAINASLRRAIEAEEFDAAAVADLFSRAATDRVTLDAHILAFSAGQRMKRAMVKLEAAATDRNPDESLQALRAALDLAESIRTMPFEVVIWQAQNIWNDLLQRSDPTYWSPDWKAGFKELGQAMNIAVEELVVEEGVSAFSGSR